MQESEWNANKFSLLFLQNYIFLQQVTRTVDLRLQSVFTDKHERKFLETSYVNLCVNIL